MKKLLLLNLVVVSLVWSATAKDESPEARRADLIRQVKQTAVYELDHELPVVSFERWLGTEAGEDAEFKWQVHDCGEPAKVTANRSRGVLTCVEARATMKDKRTIIVSLAAETSKKGLMGKPVVHSAQLITPAQTIDIPKLGDLPATLVKTQMPVKPGSDPTPAQRSLKNCEGPRTAPNVTCPLP